MRARVVGTAVALALALGPPAASAWAGAWGAPMDLGPVAGPPGFPAAYTGAVAMDASGTAVVAWATADKMVAAVRPPGGAFGAPQVLGPDPGSNARVALDGSGRALVVWNSGGSVQAAERAPGSTFARLAPVASAARSAPADVAFLADGTAIVGYRGGDRLPHVAVRAPGGTFVSSTLSTVADLLGGPVRVAAAGGYAIAAWGDGQMVGFTTRRHTTKAMVSVLMPGGGFGTPVELMTTTYDGFDLSARTQVVGMAPRIAPSGAADVAVSSVFDTGPVPLDVVCSTDTLETRAPGPAGSWTTGAGDGSASCTPDPPRAMDLATGPRDDGLLVLGRGLDEPRIAVTSKVRAVGAATYAPGPDVFVGPATPRAQVPVSVAPLSDGRYVVLFLRDDDVRAVAGEPALAFEPSVLVAAHQGITALLGAASSGSEAVAAWTSWTVVRSSTRTSGAALRVALYDDRATPTVRLSEVAMTRRRFIRSTTIRWRSSVPATLTFRVVRLNGSHERSIGSFVRSVEADMGSLRFHGVVHRHRLRPGRYRLSVVASAPAMAASAPASVTFTVRQDVRPRRAR
ncbi:MAG: hypothetical protein QOI62_1388 [Solirubrobacteraceae bacterium]|jgi:hypothetical protein|nr:hypothetical protein [Solirubrobacteraceae bacterium]